MNTEAWTKLANAPAQLMCSERELAELLGWESPRCVRRAVQRGELPPPVSLGRRSVYVVSVVREFITNRAQVMARRVVNL